MNSVKIFTMHYVHINPKMVELFVKTSYVYRVKGISIHLKIIREIKSNIFLFFKSTCRLLYNNPTTDRSNSNSAKTSYR